ncbi:MAG: rod shape-determining protein MreD [Butyrivibrio sp.]|nr:rod shape-determining protein MreD [Butyrivibrio sp.]
MSIRRILVNFLLAILTFAVQTSIFEKVLDFGGVTPDLMLVFVTSVAFLRGEKPGLLTGFFAGFLIDIFFGHLGFYAFIYMYLGFLVGKLNEVFYSQNIAIPITIISVSDFIYNFVCYVLLFLFRKQFDIGYYMMNTIIPGVVYTALVAIFYYPVILKIHERITEKEQRSEKKFV